MRAVGHAIPVGTWWLNLARQVVSRDSRDFKTLGEELAKRIGRAAPFDKALISRLRAGTATVTLELVDALCGEYRTLPRPVYFARSYSEAAHIDHAIELYNKTVGAEIDEEAPVVALPQRRRGKRLTEVAAAQPATSKRRTAR